MHWTPLWASVYISDVIAAAPVIRDVDLLRTPKVFRPRALGCEVGPSGSDRATLGKMVLGIQSIGNGLWPVQGGGATPLGLTTILPPLTQGSPGVAGATPGFGTESRWDSRRQRHETE